MLRDLRSIDAGEKYITESKFKEWLADLDALPSETAEHSVLEHGRLTYKYYSRLVAKAKFSDVVNEKAGLEAFRAGYLLSMHDTQEKLNALRVQYGRLEICHNCAGPRFTDDYCPTGRCDL